MKSLKYLIISLVLCAGCISCGKDNYEGPKETFKGAFIDKVTKEPFQTALGGTGIRIRMMEYSWSDTPQPYDMNCMMDGKFNNTKVFKGEYGVQPEGAFVPLPEERIKIEGTVEKNYEVDPLLRIEWMGDPVVKQDGTVEVKVKIDRGTNDASYQQPLAEVWLFVSEINHVGDFCFSNNYSTKLIGANLPVLGQTTTIVSGWAGGVGVGNQKFFPTYSRKYFLRVGARTNIQFSGINRYNYTTIKEITTPDRQ